MEENLITIKIPLKEYLWLREFRGNLYLVIDQKQREEILAQNNDWAKDFYILPLPVKESGEDKDRLFQIWLLKTWQVNCKGLEQKRKISLVLDQKEEMAIKLMHNNLVAKELKIKNYLVKKGFSHSESLNIIKNAKNPRTIEVEEFDDETCEFVSKKIVNPEDLKYQDLFGLKIRAD